MNDCPCNVCNQRIFFDPSHIGETLPCPFCGMDTTLFQSPPAPPPPPSDPCLRYCPRCGTVDIPVCRTKGTLGAELLLWLLFLLPGICYSVWRLTTRAMVCPACFSDEIIPLNSPRARQLTMNP